MPLSAVKNKWLQANIIHVLVPVGGKWCFEGGQDEIDLV